LADREKVADPIYLIEVVKDLKNLNPSIQMDEKVQELVEKHENRDS